MRIRSLGELRYYALVAFVVVVSPFYFEAARNLTVRTYDMFPHAAAGQVVTALVWILSLAFTGYVLTLMVRGRSDFLRILLATLALYAIFSVNLLFLEFGLLDLLPASASYVPSLLALTLAAYALMSLATDWGMLAYSGILLLTMAGLGSLFNASLGTTSKVAILIIYSLSDLYSVRAGLLRSTNQDSKEISRTLSPLLIGLGPLNVGVGDVLFYTILMCFALEQGIFSYITSALLLGLGHSINLRLLGKDGLIPALPIPVALTLTGIILYRLLASG